jgi:glycosyltransferase involved in cell wall biosynthesis
MVSPSRLGILATHPVQYHAPAFRELAQRDDLDLTVFFAHRPTAEEQGVGFGIAFEWDVDLTSGYRVKWLRNRATHGATSTFNGCDTPEIAALIRDGRFDAFLVMGWHSRTYWQAMSACWRYGVPVLVRGDSQLLTDDRASKRLAKRALYPFFMRRFAACLSVGTRSEEYFRHYGARRIVRSPHFVDNVFFGAAADRLAPHRASLRAECGIPSAAFVCLFAGKFIEKKRPLDLVRALAKTGDRNAWGLFVGEGDLRSMCEVEAQRLGVQARFVGFMNQSQLPRAYAASDVLVLPSDARETWGLVVNEAMASGRTAIVSDHAGCAPDLIVEGVTGHVVRLGDVERLADRIASLSSRRDVNISMSTSARAHVAKFSVNAAAQGIVSAMSIERARVA